jgi:hypothetical protein
MLKICEDQLKCPKLNAVLYNYKSKLWNTVDIINI